MLKLGRHPVRKLLLLFAVLMAIVCVIVLALLLTGNLPSDQKFAEHGQGTTRSQSVSEPIDSTAQDEPATASPETLAEQPSPEELASQQIQTLISNMSLEEKVGQMVIARCPPGVSVAEAAAKADEYHLGGYILFAEDFAGRTTAEVQQDIASYQAVSEIPMFIAVDEEGGIVNRASLNPNLRSTPFPSPQALFQAGGFALVRSDALEKSQFLKNLGVNLNFAPVADVSTDPNDFINARTFGQPAPATSEYVKTIVAAMKESKIGSVLKHFPGYGNNSDTHTGLAYDHRPYETFKSSDFLPFQAGISAGANLVLVAHNIVDAIDPTAPASLSAPAHEILRQDLNFQGPIITDDLVMNGVRNFAGDEAAAVLAIKAGNDLLCSTDFETQIPAVISAVQTGEIPESRLDESLARILETKRELNLLPAANP